jgi:DNA-binding MarR family transcriptional regulator
LATTRKTSTGPLSPTELAAWRGFLRVHATMVRELDAELQALHDLPLSSYEVLLFLNEAPRRRLRMAQLADSVLLSPSGITRLVERLQAQGLVRKESSPADGRALYAVLTDSGRERLVEAAPTHLAGIRRRFLERFSESELDELARQWERVLPGAASPLSDLAWSESSSATGRRG